MKHNKSSDKSEVDKSTHFECFKGLTVEVLSSRAGYYIGTLEDGCPYCRLSKEYWKKREQAQAELENETFSPRTNSEEIVFCSKARGCRIRKV